MFDDRVTIDEIKYTVISCLIICLIIAITGGFVLGVLALAGKWPGGITDELVLYRCTVSDHGTGRCVFTNSSQLDNRRRCVTVLVKWSNRASSAEGGAEWKKDNLCSGGLRAGESIELGFSMQDEWRKCSDFQNVILKSKGLPQRPCMIAVEDHH
jgi:hypothetical protein